MIRFALISCLFCFQLYGQNDAINLDKYWKFRHDFLEDFVKIGPNQGESLPAGYLLPLACRDNIGGDGTEPSDYKYSEYGEMHWGDGTIRQGHYLGLLATEYALKKQAGMDLTGIQTELYYALNALNRLDLNAERALDDIYGDSLFYDQFTWENLENGFMLREDVGEDFCLNFESSMNFRCTNSAYYENNNAAKINKPEEYLTTKSRTSYQNVPSLDQITSLVIGILLIDKLVDDIAVQPRPSDKGFKLKSEAIAIFDRILTYASERNWIFLDVNGWPVTNGGGDLAFAAAPFILAAKRLIPEKQYPTKMHRRFALGYNDVQHCITGFGVGGEREYQEEQCKNFKYFSPFKKKMHRKLYYTAHRLDEDNNVFESNFLDYMRDGLIAMDIMRLEGAWDNLIVEKYKNYAEDWEDDYRISLLPWPLSKVTLDKMHLTSSNATIAFNLGVTSGLWTSQEVHDWANLTGNRQLELINAILYENSPVKKKAFYQSFLNSLNPEGAYFLKTAWPAEVQDSLFHQDGWATEYRWTHKSQQFGGDGAVEGIFSNMDYMLFHNLYYLAFEEDLPSFDETFECFCNDKVAKSREGQIDDKLRVAQKMLNRKLSHVPSSVKSAFASKFNLIDNYFKVESNFNYYQDHGISTPRFVTEDSYITRSGIVDINTDLIICNEKRLSIQSGGSVNLNKGSILIKQKSVLDVYGELHINEGQELMLRKFSEINLYKGAQVYIHDNATLKIGHGSTMNYYGGQIYTDGNSTFELNGTLTMKRSGTFELNHKNSKTSGQFIIDGGRFTKDSLVQGKCSIIIKGKNNGDEHLILGDNAGLFVFENQIEAIDELIISQCKPVLTEYSIVSIQSSDDISTLRMDSTSTSSKESSLIDYSIVNRGRNNEYVRIHQLGEYTTKGSFVHQFMDSKNCRVTRDSTHTRNISTPGNLPENAIVQFGGVIRSDEYNDKLTMHYVERPYYTQHELIESLLSPNVEFIKDRVIINFNILLNDSYSVTIIGKNAQVYSPLETTTTDENTVFSLQQFGPGNYIIRIKMSAGAEFSYLAFVN